jgi:hypothetical protein
MQDHEYYWKCETHKVGEVTRDFWRGITSHEGYDDRCTVIVKKTSVTTYAVVGR